VRHGCDAPTALKGAPPERRIKAWPAKPASRVDETPGQALLMLDIRFLTDDMLDAAEAEARTRLDGADAIARSQEAEITGHYRRSRRDIPLSIRHEQLEWELLNASPTMIRAEAQVRLAEIAAERARRRHSGHP